jgi:hypothetical protein
MAISAASRAFPHQLFHLDFKYAATVPPSVMNIAREPKPKWVYFRSGGQ